MLNVMGIQNKNAKPNLEHGKKILKHDYADF